MGTEVRFRTLVADIYSSVGLNLASITLGRHDFIYVKVLKLTLSSGD
ncbi:MAG: hypothetical protein NTV39_03650 [Candidatus Saccharibacteria bacterium]|nr:hypothetical protein [Candidatus Saccharibacteria bacterium]